MKKLFGAIGLSTLLLAGGARAAISFAIDFTAGALSDLDATEQAMFSDAIDFWDSVIDDHRDGGSRIWTLTVDTFSEAAENGGVTLGSAGPNGLTFSGVVGDSHTSDGRFIISTGGNAGFNVHPDAGPLNPLTIRHEIGHALGIGTLWENNEVYNDGVEFNSNRTLAGGTPGQYMGAAALAAYQAEFDPTATFIPVELDGGGGTANGHWNEVLDNFSVENLAGFDSDPGDEGPPPSSGDGSLDDELMTGVLSNPGYLSTTTIMSLYDIGFTVIVPVPETSASALLGVTLLFLGRRRRG